MPGATSVNPASRTGTTPCSSHAARPLGSASSAPVHRRQSAGDAGRTAAMGYCFGGAGALQLARTGADLKGVVTFHAALTTGPEGEAERIQAKVLVLTGAVDPVVPPEAVDAFEDELRRVEDLDWQVVVYSGSMHAFTEPDADAPEHGAQFNPVAEARSWQAMKDFFAEVL